MTRYLLFVLTSVIFKCVNAETVTKSCPDYQVLIKCSHECPSDYCPTKRNQTQTCYYSNVCEEGRSECKCGVNYRFVSRHNKTCIPTTSCPAFPCGENEVYDSCPDYCSESCDNASPDGERCHFIGIIGISVDCRPDCRCKKNYWRNKDNKCVPYSECPPRCPEDEVLQSCPRDCPSDYCPTYNNEPQDCKSSSGICLPACKCRFNYRYASHDNKTCIRTTDCPAFPCGCNEEYNSCPVSCSESCQDATPDGKRCKDMSEYESEVAKNKSILKCNPACRCIDNYWRNEDDECVEYDDCFENCELL